MKSSIADIRKDYTLQQLDEAQVASDPLLQFDAWWQEAIRSEILEVNAMTLATADVSGQPSARTVLLKEYNKDGFVFFTNYQSDKARDMAAVPKVSLLFFWKELERQVRIEGTAEKIPESASDAYYHSRPEGSRIGAWASPQSQVIASRAIIEHNVQHYQQEFQGKTINRPPHWGGYCVKPERMEFWQGRPSRLHDRIRYRREHDQWIIERLAP
jgi:pyridoxamine 5'-phosphate oxidase